MAFIYSEDFLKYDFRNTHPLNQLRIKLHYKLLQELKIFDSPNVSIETPRSASEEELMLVHTPEYVAKIKELSVNGSGEIGDPDTPPFKGMFEAAKLAVGGTLTAIDLVMSGKVDHAWNPGGGFHHAKKDKARGFCIFNDVAIGINYLRNKYGISKIMYVDIDAHHADGVQEIFYNTSDVLKVSFHESGRYLFPHTGFTSEIGEGEGRGYSINVPLPMGTFDEAYIHTFEKIIPLLIEYFQPEVIIYLCGADGHYLDPLSHLSLTTETYSTVTELLHQLSHKYCDGKLIGLGGGGYSLNATTRIWSLIFIMLCGIDPPTKLPDSWVDCFKQLVTTESAPQQLLDKNKPPVNRARYVKISSEIKRIINEVEENVYLNYGFFKL